MLNSLALFAGLVSLSSVAAVTINVNVSDSLGSLTYSPSSISATANDIVVFTFRSGNHTVSESNSISDPCTPKVGGIDSSFQLVTANSILPTFTVTVDDSSTPRYFMCKQGQGTPKTHCGQGMVFEINPGATGTSTSFAQFQKNALAVGASLGAGSSSSSITRTATGTGTATGTNSAPATTIASHSGATTFNVGVVMLMAAVGTSFGLLA